MTAALTSSSDDHATLMYSRVVSLIFLHAQMVLVLQFLGIRLELTCNLPVLRT